MYPLHIIHKVSKNCVSVCLILICHSQILSNSLDTVSVATI